MRNPQICWDKIFPGDRETLRQMIREQAAGGTSRELLYRIQDDSGKLRWIETRAEVSELDSGRQDWNGYWLDVTDA